MACRGPVAVGATRLRWSDGASGQNLAHLLNRGCFRVDHPDIISGQMFSTVMIPINK